MAKIAIVTDTIACLPREMVEQYQIRLVAPNIHFEGRIYRDWLDISPAEAYQLLERSPQHFCTSPASPGEYIEAYRELSTRAESILCITISSELSTLYNTALIAKEQVKEELPQTTIEVLDSQTATAAEGFVVLAAARSIAEGKDLAEVIEAAKKVRERVSVICLMETIRHIYRTGRIPKVAARLGSIFNVKPIFTIREGAAHFVTVARTRERGVDRLLKMMRRRVSGKPVHAAVMHADALEEGKRLEQLISAEFNCVELWLTEFSPIMGYSTGRGLLGLAFYAED